MKRFNLLSAPQSQIPWTKGDVSESDSPESCIQRFADVCCRLWSPAPGEALQFGSWPNSCCTWHELLNILSTATILLTSKIIGWIWHATHASCFESRGGLGGEWFATRDQLSALPVQNSRDAGRPLSYICVCVLSHRTHKRKALFMYYSNEIWR